MKLVREFELATKSDKELEALLNHAFNERSLSTVSTQDHTNAVKTIENIWREMRFRG